MCNMKVIKYLSFISFKHIKKLKKHKSVGSCWVFHGLSCIILSLPGAGQPALPVDEAGAGCCTVVSSLTMGEV